MRERRVNGRYDALGPRQVASSRPGGAARFTKSFVPFVPFCGLICQVVDSRDDPVGNSGDKGCRGDRENPGPDDATGYAPFDG